MDTLYDRLIKFVPKETIANLPESTKNTYITKPFKIDDHTYTAGTGKTPQEARDNLQKSLTNK